MKKRASDLCLLLVHLIYNHFRRLLLAKTADRFRFAFQLNSVLEQVKDILLCLTIHL